MHLAPLLHRWGLEVQGNEAWDGSQRKGCRWNFSLGTRHWHRHGLAPLTHDVAPAPQVPVSFVDAVAWSLITYFM